MIFYLELPRKLLRAGRADGHAPSWVRARWSTEQTWTRSNTPAATSKSGLDLKPHIPVTRQRLKLFPSLDIDAVCSPKWEFSQLVSLGAGLCFRGCTNGESRSDRGIRMQQLEAGAKRGGGMTWISVPCWITLLGVCLVAVVSWIPFQKGLGAVQCDVKEGMRVVAGGGGSSTLLSSFPCWTSRIMSN